MWPLVSRWKRLRAATKVSANAFTIALKVSADIPLPRERDVCVLAASSVPIVQQAGAKAAVLLNNRQPAAIPFAEQAALQRTLIRP